MLAETDSTEKMTGNKKGKKDKKAYTLIELLVAMAILVIAFALVTILYVRASRVRRIISAGSEIQQVLNQMMRTLAYRDRTNTVKSLSTATNLYQQAGWVFGKYLVFGNAEEQKKQYYYIAPGENEPSSTGSDTTLWYGEAVSIPPANWICLDPNRRVTLLSGSCFEFYDGSNRKLESVENETPVRVVIQLIGKSNDPSLKTREPVLLKTGLRLRNKPSF